MPIQYIIIRLLRLLLVEYYECDILNYADGKANTNKFKIIFNKHRTIYVNILDIVGTLYNLFNNYWYF